MSEKRKESRKNLMAFTPVYGLQPRVLLGYVEDLTVLGTMVIGEKRMEANDQLTLEIEFPNDVPEIATPYMTIPARVAWCKTADSPRYYSVGFEFTELKPDDQKVIESILRRYQFRRELPPAHVG